MSKATTAKFQWSFQNSPQMDQRNEAVSYLINHAWYLHVSTTTDQYTCTVSEFEVHKKPIIYGVLLKHCLQH